MGDQKVAVLVVSCDAYSDLWGVFFHMFEKNWRDCPYPVHLLSNSKVYESGQVKTLCIGKDNSWSDGLIKGVNQLEGYEYVFLIMEDMFILNRIDTPLIRKTVDKFLSLDGNFITFLNEPKPDKKSHELFGTISKGAMYRTTATAALWKREVLLDLLDETESAWSFEKVGSQRSDKYDKFFAVYKHQFTFLHGVIKGKWLPDTVKALQKIGVEFEIQRPLFEGKSEWSRKVYHMVRKTILRVTPFKYRRKLLRMK